MTGLLSTACRVVRLPPPGGDERRTAPADGWADQIEQRAAEWVAAIARFLPLPAAVAVPSEVVIILRPGLPLPMSRGNEVALPVAPADDLGLVLAGLPHELVHVVAGRSPSHLLNEGLAVYVDDHLRLAGPVWPFFELSARRWARLMLDDGNAMPLHALVSATRRPASATTKSYDAAGPRSNEGGLPVLTRYYLLAASVVEFMIASQGWPAFWTAFRSGELPAGIDVEDMERGWLASLGGPGTTEERELQRRSVAAYASTYFHHPGGGR